MKDSKSKALNGKMGKKDFYMKAGEKTETVHHMNKRHKTEESSFQNAFKKRFK